MREFHSSAGAHCGPHLNRPSALMLPPCRAPASLFVCLAQSNILQHQHRQKQVIQDRTEGKRHEMACCGVVTGGRGEKGWQRQCGVRWAPSVGRDEKMGAGVQGASARQQRSAAWSLG